MSTPQASQTPILENSQTPTGGGLLWLLAALLASAAVFWNATAGELVYDDLALIAQNPLIADLGNLPDLLLKPLWDFQNPGSSEQTGYWRPLTSVVYALAWAVDDGAPWAFHAASILFHLAATGAAFCLARRLSGQGWIGGAVALLFGLHPVHVESVAWISALNDPLFASLGLFSLVAFLGWRQRGSRGLPVLSALAFGLALAAKEMALALLPLLILIDLFVGGPSEEHASIKHWFRIPREALRAYLPFALMLALYVGLRMWIFESPMAGFDERVSTDFGVGAERMALLRVELWGGALRLLYWPSELRLFRPFAPNLSLENSAAQVALGLCIASALILVLCLLTKRRRLFFALLIIPISFAPVLVRADSVGLFPNSDRYLYLAVFGAALFALLALGRLLPERPLQVLVLLVAICFGYQSYERTKVWETELKLFGTETQAREDSVDGIGIRSPYVYWGYGRVLLNMHSRTKQVSYLQEAKRAFENSMFLLEESKTPEGQDIFASSSDYLQANLGYANCIIIEDTINGDGNSETAIAILSQLLDVVSKIHQDADKATRAGKTLHGYLPPIELIYASLGFAHMTARNMDEAAAALRKSLLLNPRNVEALKNSAKVELQRDNRVLAIKHLRDALKISPRNSDLMLALAQILQFSNKTTEALDLATRLLETTPNHPGAHWVFASALLEDNKPREALVHLYQAQELDEFDGTTWLLIAQALATIGTDKQGMIEAFRKAARFKPDDIKGHYNLASLLFNDGKHYEALPYFIRAYALAREPQVLLNLRTALPQLPFKNPAELMQLSASDWRRGDFDLVEFWLGRALELQADYPPALMDVGRLLLKRERIEEGLDFMRRACEAGKSFGDLVEYGQSLSDAGNLLEAKRIFEQARTVPIPADLREKNRLQLVKRLMEKLEAKLAGKEPSGSPEEGL